MSKKFGEDFLLQHEVNQLESSVMEMIKSKWSNFCINYYYKKQNLI